MEPVLTVILAWLAFAGTHVGLATEGVRSRLVSTLGERGFMLLFSAVAAVLLTALVATYAAVRFEGLAGPALGRFPGIRESLIVLVVAGVVLMTASFAGYDRSPYAGIEHRSFRSPLGLERVTRHPFFAGLVLFALAHALLATKLVGTVFLLGYAALAAAGSWHQDRKLERRFGAPFTDYLRATSAVPFAAIATGRQRLVWSELPRRAMAAGLALAVVLRLVHDSIFSYGGAVFVGAFLSAVAVIVVTTFRREAGEREGTREGTLLPSVTLRRAPGKVTESNNVPL